MTAVGAVFRPQLAPERLRSVAIAADQAGLDQMWLWEDCFRESGIAAGAAALAWTDRLKIGIGLLPVPLRNVALTAMEWATLDRLFPGRALIGLGHGVLDWMGQVGVRVASPLTLLTEHLESSRALLAGQEVTVAGRYVTLDRVKLDWPPHTPPPILAGAEGPKTLKLVGAHADGAILTSGTTPEGVRRARGLLDEGRTAAGRQAEDYSVTVYVVTAFGTNAAQRVVDECRRWGWSGHDDRSVSGDVSSVAEDVRRWAEAGADTIVLQPTEDEPSQEDFMACAAQVGALLD